MTGSVAQTIIDEMDKKLADIASWTHAKAIQNIDDDGITDRGILKRESGFQQIKPLHWQVFFRAEHAEWVENGTRPHEAPAAPFIAYAQRRGMTDPERAGWAIRNKIAKYGTPPRLFLARAIAQMKSKFGGFS